MIYQVVYKNSDGQVLKEATFNAISAKEALRIMVTVDSFEAPDGTVDVDVNLIGEDNG